MSDCLNNKISLNDFIHKKSLNDWKFRNFIKKIGIQPIENQSKKLTKYSKKELNAALVLFRIEEKNKKKSIIT